MCMLISVFVWIFTVIMLVHEMIRHGTEIKMKEYLNDRLWKTKQELKRQALIEIAHHYKIIDNIDPNIKPCDPVRIVSNIVKSHGIKI